MRLQQFMLTYGGGDYFERLGQGWAIISSPRASLAIHIFVEGSRKN
jgi:hypothetical protein